MQIEPQLSFRGLERSPAIEAKVGERVARLDRYYARIMSCRVMIEAPHRHHHQGKIYHVRVEVTVPGRELVTSRDPAERQAHDDVYVAIRDAFDAMDRQLEDYARQQRGDVKTHVPPAHGRIVEILPGEGSGLIMSSDGRSIGFHRNAVVGARFEVLRLGDEVRFVEQPGEDGPRASTVTPVGKHHVVG